MTLGLADRMDGDNVGNFLELYRRGESGTLGVIEKIDESFCFQRYEHIM